MFKLLGVLLWFYCYQKYVVLVIRVFYVVSVVVRIIAIIGVILIPLGFLRLFGVVLRQSDISSSHYTKCDFLPPM